MYVALSSSHCYLGETYGQFDSSRPPTLVMLEAKYEELQVGLLWACFSHLLHNYALYPPPFFFLFEHLIITYVKSIIYVYKLETLQTGPWCQFAEVVLYVYLERLINDLDISPLTYMIQIYIYIYIYIYIPPTIHLYLESRYLANSNFNYKF